MTDAFNDVNSSNNLEGTDVSQIGKVVINAVLNQSLINYHKQNLSDGNTDFRSTGNEKNFGINHGELCWSFKEISVANPRNREYTPQVLSSFNGMAKTNEDLNDLINFEGIALGSGATYDERSQNPSIDLALTTGGLRTVTNNSNVMIANGDLLMWTAPNKNNRKDEGRRGSEKYLMKLEVYKPENHLFNLKMIANFLNEDNTDDNVVKQDVKLFVESMNEIIGTGSALDYANMINQKSAQFLSMTKLLASISYFNHRNQKRIFAKALCPAKPGAKVDIQCGRYEI